MSSWLKPEVARAQFDVAVRVLSTAPTEVEPFRHFIEAMNLLVPQPQSILDVGCGVGMYGVLCQRYYPHLQYCGTDFSPAMIKQARLFNPRGRYSVCQFNDNAFERYGIILLGSVLEYAGTWAALHTVLSKRAGHIIFNRIRLTDGASATVLEDTYCGNTEPQYMWNRKQLLDLLGNRLIKDIEWTDKLQHTLIVRNQ